MAGQGKGACPYTALVFLATSGSPALLKPLSAKPCTRD